MGMGFSKTFFDKKLDSSKKSEIIDSESFYGASGGKDYKEKISEAGLSYSQMHMMYLSNVWVRVCVDKIVERVTNIEPIIKPINVDIQSGKIPNETKKNMDLVADFLANPNSNYESLIEIRKKWARDVLKYDAAGIEILKGIDIKNTKRIAEIYTVPGDSIKINANKKGILDKTKAYVQVDSGMKKIASWKPEQLMYFMNNPQSNKIYGVSPLETLVQTVTADLYSSQYNLDFFYNNATPRIAILMEGLGIGQGKTALTRVRKWWDDELRGNPHRPIIMGTEQGKVQIQKIGLSNEEMQFQEYSAFLLTKIMAMYKLQPIVLGIVGMGTGTTGGATGNVEEQMRQFKLDAVQPLLKLWWQKLNQRVIFDKDVLNINDVYVDYDLDLTDKKSQAEWHEIYLRSGCITINEIRTSGLGLMPVPWGNVPYMQNNLIPFGAGKNGQAVPGNPAEANEAASQDGASEIATITQSTSRGDLQKFLSKDTKNPVGWEQMPVGERLKIIEQLIKEREKFLTKVYMIPESKVLS